MRAIAGVLALAAATVHADDARIEARRYTNAQGVEILTNRQADAPRPPPAAAAPAPSSAERVDQRVGARQQSVRDEERLRILGQEMATESQSLDTKRKALRSPRALTDLPDDVRQKLADDIARHEANLQALTREVRQIKPVSATAAR